MVIIKCETLTYYINFYMLDFLQETLSIFHSITFQEMKIELLMHMQITYWIGT